MRSSSTAKGTSFLVLKLKELEKAAAANPFFEAEASPKSLHLWFLVRRPTNPDLSGLHQVQAPNERFALKGKVFYLHAPDGIGRSRLAARVEKCLGVDATSRNWSTVMALIDLARQA